MHSGPVAAAKEGEPPATVSWASVCVYAARCDCGTRAPRLRRPSSRSAARLLPPKVLQQDYPRAVARRCRLQQPVSKLCRVGGILAPNVVSQPVVISQRVLRRAGCANQRGTPPPAQRECAWSSCRSPPSSSSGGSISASDTAANIGGGEKNSARSIGQQSKRLSPQPAASSSSHAKRAHTYLSCLDLALHPFALHFCLKLHQRLHPRASMKQAEAFISTSMLGTDVSKPHMQTIEDLTHNRRRIASLDKEARSWSGAVRHQLHGGTGGPCERSAQNSDAHFASENFQIELRPGGAQ